MRNFYKEQSSNRYTVNGDVTNWVQVPNNEAFYGNNGCGSIVCSDTWKFVNDSVDAWAATMSTTQANAYLAQFDVWDRYDTDGDGNFNEPDGYIDHFQSIHAGMGEEVGGGAQGANAIWSHRWYAYYPGSPAGPDGAGPHGFQGVRIGNTNYWIGDYTIEPENGGVGVFSHEFAHDLGLPDEYDTSGNTGGAENSTAWWTLMSQGSYGTQTDDLGSLPDAHERMGQVPARVAELRGRPRRPEVRAQARAGGVQHEAGPGCVRSAAGQGRHAQHRVSLRGLELLLLGRRERPHDRDVAVR